MGNLLERRLHQDRYIQLTISSLRSPTFYSRIIMKNHLTDYIESKGYTVQECYRPIKKEVPDNMKHRYSTYEEYQEALHDFLNGM